jgi:hypothetical protein
MGQHGSNETVVQSKGASGNISMVNTGGNSYRYDAGTQIYNVNAPQTTSNVNMGSFPQPHMATPFNKGMANVGFGNYGNPSHDFGQGGFGQGGFGHGGFGQGGFGQGGFGHGGFGHGGFGHGGFGHGGFGHGGFGQPMGNKYGYFDQGPFGFGHGPSHGPKGRWMGEPDDEFAYVNVNDVPPNDTSDLTHAGVEPTVEPNCF